MVDMLLLENQEMLIFAPFASNFSRAVTSSHLFFLFLTISTTILIKILLFAKLNVAYLYISSYISYYYIIAMEKYTIIQKHIRRENL